MAELIEIPVLKAGMYKGLEIQSNDLEKMAQISNINVPYIKELAKKDQKIPSYINFNHSDILPDTIKDTTQTVSPLFATKVIDGEQWIVVSLQGVPNDVADTIIKHFPLRSVEIIHNLHNPYDDTDYQNVIRSIGFLDKFTPPAVAGQDDKLSVIYNAQHETESSVTVATLEIYQQEENGPMAEEKQEQLTIFKEEDVKELIEEQVKRKEEELKADFNAKVEQLAAEKDALQERIQEGQRKAYETEIAMFMESLETKHHVTPAGMEVVKTIVDPMSYDMVTKLSENEASPFEAMKHGLEKILELSEKGVLILNDEQITTPGETKQPGSMQEQRAEAIASYMEKAGGSYNEAWGMAAKDETTKHLFIPQYVKSK